MADTTPNTIPLFLPLTGIYEPSAILQLADGRFLVVEDERKHPFSLVAISPDGCVNSTPLGAGFQDAGAPFRELDDLEGATLDRSGNIYAITSYSRDEDGDKKKSRNRLVRFRIEGDRIVDPSWAKGLKSALCAAHPVLAAAAKIRDVKDAGGLNIEALAISTGPQRMLIGFRSPLPGKRAIIAIVENPAAMFDAGEPPRITPTLITLDLDGYGIRGMAWFPALNGYLLIGGPASSAQVQFQIWFWSGHPDEPARQVSVPGLPGFEHAEGVSPAVMNGQPRIIIVSDDGSRKEGRSARFMLLDPGQLQIAP